MSGPVAQRMTEGGEQRAHGTLIIVKLKLYHKITTLRCSCTHPLGIIRIYIREAANHCLLTSIHIPSPTPRSCPKIEEPKEKLLPSSTNHITSAADGVFSKPEYFSSGDVSFGPSCCRRTVSIQEGHRVPKPAAPVR